ncbi:hypothetical protein DPMN_107856 [Dreissena polymorpha]|uniref:Uncharacterized protein n=1 Tax=Dreissena polymorpha TaxID=45954 RepID=A0A9D4QLF9_DREPO|nr:hypothetical protein DPMN_107856 [Dreissena polymorpha]
MASAGFGMRLSLHPDAVPTLFPDTDNFKALQPKALRPDELGAPKRKRDNYGAFAKRNRKTARRRTRNYCWSSEASVFSLTFACCHQLNRPRCWRLNTRWSANLRQNLSAFHTQQ